MFKLGTVVESRREGSGDVIVLEINGGEVFEVTNERWDWPGDGFVDEGKSGDGAIGAGDLRPITVGGGVGVWW
ncbi:unnamed protein product [Camellia sinensis]